MGDGCATALFSMLFEGIVECLSWAPPGKVRIFNKPAKPKRRKGSKQPKPFQTRDKELPG